MLTAAKKEFIEFMMSADVLRFGDFTTKSGRKTPYFVNTGNYKTGLQNSRLGEFYAALVLSLIHICVPFLNLRDIDGCRLRYSMLNTGMSRYAITKP